MHVIDAYVTFNLVQRRSAQRKILQVYAAGCAHVAFVPLTLLTCAALLLSIINNSHAVENAGFSAVCGGGMELFWLRGPFSSICVLLLTRLVGR